MKFWESYMWMFKRPVRRASEIKTQEDWQVPVELWYLPSICMIPSYSNCLEGEIIFGTFWNPWKVWLRQNSMHCGSKFGMKLHTSEVSAFFKYVLCLPFLPVKRQLVKRLELIPRLRHGQWLQQSAMKSWWKQIKLQDLPVKLVLCSRQSAPKKNQKKGEWKSRWAKCAKFETSCAAPKNFGCILDRAWIAMVRGECSKERWTALLMYVLEQLYWKALDQRGTDEFERGFSWYIAPTCFTMSLWCPMFIPCSNSR